MPKRRKCWYLVQLQNKLKSKPPNELVYIKLFLFLHWDALFFLGFHFFLVKESNFFTFGLNQDDHDTEIDPIFAFALELKVLMLDGSFLDQSLLLCPNVVITPPKKKERKNL